jgi:hypothetical protein
MVPSPRGLVVALVSAGSLAFAGCGGPAKPATSSTTEAGGDAGCEPGRCLPDISRTVLARRAEARACVDSGRTRDPQLSGTLLVIKFEIDPDGRVVDASQGSQEDQIEDAEVVDCVIGVIRELAFQASAKGKSTRAYHRFEFNRR